jgi:diguanylate cyclase (GGDEF)-like protein
VSAQRTSDLERIVAALDEHIYSGELLADGRFVEHYSGPAAERFLGRPLRPGEDPETAWLEAVHPDDREVYRGVDELLRACEPAEMHYRMRHADGGTVWAWERMWSHRLPDGRLIVDGIVADVTERQAMLTELAEASARLASIAEAVDHYFYTAEQVGGQRFRLVYQGRGRDVMLRRIGRRSDDSESWIEAIHPEDRERVLAEVRRRSDDGEIEYRIVGEDGSERWMWDRYRMRRDDGGRLFFDGVVSDITERRRAADELAAARDQAERRSRTDELTGVANRRHFAELLDAVLAAAPQERRSPGVLLLDVDRFKRINDTYGHASGDQVLVEIARRLRSRIRRDDAVARWGGEEFIVLARDAPDDRALRRIGETIRHAIADRPFVTGGHALHVTASVGAARLDAGHPDREAILVAADQALYAAKRRGRNQTRVAAEVSEVEALQEDPEGGALATALALSASLREGMPPLHAEQVGDLSGRIAERLGLSPGFAARCRLAGLLHDIGKIAIPDRVLAKPGPLTVGEHSLMRMHAEMGEQMARHIAGLSDAAPGIRHHHERWDGQGYPDGLAGEQIPLEARIIGCADAYSAMTCRRVYSNGREHQDALRELGAERGAHFDPAVVEALLSVLDEQHGAAEQLLGV